MSRDWRAAAQRLVAAGFTSAQRDAQILAREADDFEAAIARRVTGEPVSHILGTRAFWKHDFAVSADVLDPRPDTETLVEAALGVPFERVLDLGTGSGCILISLLSERLEARGLGIDASPKALDVARGNGTRIGVDARCDWAVSDWFSNVEDQFDLIVSNPPYIDADSYQGLDKGVREFEPKMALTPGGDGMAAYRVIAAGAGAYLKADGLLMVEIGFDQSEAVSAIFEENGWDDPKTLCDLNGKSRVIMAQARQK